LVQKKQLLPKKIRSLMLGPLQLSFQDKKVLSKRWREHLRNLLLPIFNSRRIVMTKNLLLLLANLRPNLGSKGRHLMLLRKKKETTILLLQQLRLRLRKERLDCRRKQRGFQRISDKM
jgi:hypothetical protein